MKGTLSYSAGTWTVRDDSGVALVAHRGDERLGTASDAVLAALPTARRVSITWDSDAQTFRYEAYARFYVLVAEVVGFRVCDTFGPVSEHRCSRPMGRDEAHHEADALNALDGQIETAFRKLMGEVQS